MRIELINEFEMRIKQSSEKEMKLNDEIRIKLSNENEMKLSNEVEII